MTLGRLFHWIAAVIFLIAALPLIIVITKVALVPLGLFFLTLGFLFAGTAMGARRL